MSKRVAIVGAGPGGLAAAMLLAKAGLNVTVFEARPEVGGRTSAITADGFRFDVGPTFFLYPDVLAGIFRATGYDLYHEVPMVRLVPQYRIVFGQGGRLDCTPDVSAMQAAIRSLSPGDAANFPRWLADNREKFARFKPCLEIPYLGWGDLFTERIFRLLPWLRPLRSLDQDLQRFFADPRVRLAMSFQSKYLGMSPFRCPSAFSILSFLEYEYGVFHPLGGCSAVTATMARLATELGAEIRLGQPVESLLFDGRRAVGVRTPDGDVRADAVVINADFAHAMTKLVPNALRRRWTDERIARKQFSCSTFMLYLGVEGRYDELLHHNIYISTDYVRNLEEVETQHVLSEDPSFYVQNACVTDPGLAPEGMSTLYVLVPVTHLHPNVDWARERDRYRDIVLRQLERMGITGLQQRIRYERCVTPADWESKAMVYRGAVFNLAHTLGQMLHLRPHNRFEDLQATYLVGGGTHPGSGLPVIFESAKISARLLLQDLGLHDQVHLTLPEGG